MKTRFWKGVSAPVYIAIIAVIILVVSILTLGLLTINKTITSTGTVVIATPNLEVYSDSQGTQSLTSFDWGSITPGTPVTKTIYIKNTGDVSLNLTMAPNGWDPAIVENSMELTWDKQDSTLDVNQITPAVLTLTVDSNISDVSTFSVNIVITGTG